MWLLQSASSSLLVAVVRQDPPPSFSVNYSISQYITVYHSILPVYHSILYLASRGWHFFRVPIRDVEQHTGRLDPRVRGGGSVWLVTDKESSSLQLNDISLLQLPECRISQHHNGSLGRQESEHQPMHTNDDLCILIPDECCYYPATLEFQLIKFLKSSSGFSTPLLMRCSKCTQTVGVREAWSVSASQVSFWVFL